MRKLSLILLLAVGMATFNGCDEKERLPEFTFFDLPAASQTFLTEYFPDNEIVSIGIDKRQGTRGTRSENKDVNANGHPFFYVLLQGDIHVVFAAQGGDWISVEAADGMPLSATNILNGYVYGKLKEKEPQAAITAFYSLNGPGIGITLDNGRNYAQTHLLAYGGVTLGEADIKDEDFKSKYNEFLKRNKLEAAAANGHLFKITEDEGTAYRLFIGNALVVSFDEKGEWIHGEAFDWSDNTAGGERFLTGIGENELPESIGEAIRGVGNLGKIRVIASYGNGNYGFRFEKRDLLVNKDKGILPPPSEIVDKLIADYYDTSYKSYYPQGITLVGAYEYRYSFLYENKNTRVLIDTDPNGAWSSIKAVYVEKDHSVDLSLPSKMVEGLLPEKILDYLDTYYKGSKVYSLIRHAQVRGYSLNIDERHMLYFDEDGTFLRMVQFGKVPSDGQG